MGPSSVRLTVGSVTILQETRKGSLWYAVTSSHCSWPNTPSQYRIHWGALCTRHRDWQTECRSADGEQETNWRLFFTSHVCSGVCFWRSSTLVFYCRCSVNSTGVVIAMWPCLMDQRVSRSVCVLSCFTFCFVHVKLRTKKHIMHAFMMSSSFDIINFLNRQQTLSVYFIMFLLH